MNKILFVFIAFLLFISKSYSQHKKTHYVSENNQFIGFLEYQKKIESRLFTITYLKNDTVLIKKLRYKEYFGKLSVIKKEQLNKILKKRFDIDTTKILLIHQLDSLLGPTNNIQESSFMHLFSVKNNLFSNSLNYNTFIRSENNKPIESSIYYKELKNEKNNLKTPEATLIHFYKTNNGFPEDYIRSLNYFKNPNNNVTLFFNDGILTYQVILIHKNGDYYISSFRTDNHKKLLNKKYYNRKKKQWLRKLRTSN